VQFANKLQWQWQHCISISLFLFLTTINISAYKVCTLCEQTLWLAVHTPNKLVSSNYFCVLWHYCCDVQYEKCITYKLGLILQLLRRLWNRGVTQLLRMVQITSVFCEPGSTHIPSHDVLLFLLLKLSITMPKKKLFIIQS
jgi:hypothetical protein